MLVPWAQQTAEKMLAAELPRRWRHVQAVAAKAGRASAVLPAADRDVLVAAAWLHDVGYSSMANRVGFHPLDGARWLREAGADDRLTGLVANHSCAYIEAEERGLSLELEQEFTREQSPTADVLWWADMTTGPDGQSLELAERLAEIRTRYGPDDVVTRVWARAEPVIVETCGRVERLIRSADVGL